MVIRQTRTNDKAAGEGYFTSRLVRGERIGGKVRQITVLNLGRDFSIKPEDWPVLCSRLEQPSNNSCNRRKPQETLLAIDCSEPIERAAQRYFGQRIARSPLPEAATGREGQHAKPAATERPAADFHEVDIDSLQQSQPRSAGVEHAALQALAQLGFVKKLAELGINGITRAAILGNLIGRMAQPRPRNLPPGAGCKHPAPWRTDRCRFRRHVAHGPVPGLGYLDAPSGRD